VLPLSKFGDFASHLVADPKKLKVSCDIIISVVRDKQETLDLCFNDQGIFNATVTDGDGLAMYYFSLRNSSSKSFFNYPAVSINGLISANLTAASFRTFSHFSFSISNTSANAFTAFAVDFSLLFTLPKN